MAVWKRRLLTGVAVVIVLTAALLGAGWIREYRLRSYVAGLVGVSTQATMDPLPVVRVGWADTDCVCVIADDGTMLAYTFFRGKVDSISISQSSVSSGRGGRAEVLLTREAHLAAAHEIVKKYLGVDPTITPVEYVIPGKCQFRVDVAPENRRLFPRYTLMVFSKQPWGWSIRALVGNGDS